LGEVARRVLVDEPDRRAGEDVVELLEEQQLPEPLELGTRIFAAAGDREQLGVVQPLFGPAVAALDEGLRRIGAAVVLEIELADDDGSRAGLGLERLEELPRRGDARAR